MASRPQGKCSRRPRVLVIAEQANPEFVSVPLVGWSLAQALRDVADVHLVTQIRNRAAILRAGLVEGQDFTAIDSEAVARPAHRLASALRLGSKVGWTINTAIETLTYPYFERLVWRAFRDRLAGGAFDIVHRVTPLSPTATSPIAPRIAGLGLPFVMGPLNGGVPWPPGFEAERRAEREWLSYVRGLYRLMPGRGATLKAAALIFAGSRHTLSEIPERHRHKAVWLPENAVDPARFNRVAAQAPDGPLRASFIGRLVPYKGPDMLLEAAAALVRAGRLTVDIVGDGPLMEPLKAEAARLGIDAGVTFHGWLDHRAVQDVVADTHVLAFPSVREFGGGVVLEAMALGVVPIVVDYAGPGELVDEEIGFKVPIDGRTAVIAGTAAALAQAAADRPALAQMGAAARARVAERYTWARKAEAVAEAYARLLGGEGSIQGSTPGNSQGNPHG